MSGIANWFNGINHLFLFDRLGIISGALRFMILWVDPDVLSFIYFFALTAFFPFKLLIYFLSGVMILSMHTIAGFTIG